MKHQIRKQVIVLHLDAQQNAFLIQQQAREYYYRQIVPAMQKLFDELATENEIISIDTLEIDLGELGWKNDHFTLDESGIYSILKDSFKKVIPVRSGISPTRSEITYRTVEESACLQWIHYMENGVLPWEIRSTDTKWHEKILHQLAIDHVLIEIVKKSIAGNYWFLSRLVREHDDNFLRQLTEVITAKKQDDLTRQIDLAVRQSERRADQPPLTKNKIWQAVFMSVARGETEVDVEKILQSSEKVKSQPVLSSPNKNIEEGLFCKYAGLVLLHPFFKHLFNHLQLIHDGVFINKSSREKAIILLYFIATGRTDAEDHELVVPKILCGLPLHEVTGEDAFMLTAGEKEEALNMMYAAIEQWPILQNTSPDGLREGFLTRAGKVVIKDTGVVFTVESNAIDVLLDHLPWNLSLIRLPWLNELIRVEWR
jgi:hypothetical protein